MATRGPASGPRDKAPRDKGRRRPPAKQADPQLAPYAAKREFARTPEPGPLPAPERGGPLLFVVQKHAARRLHYDFRLELDGVLKSWAVPKGPSLDPRAKRMAVAVEDHPFDYASFEGVIPAGEYGAGRVIVWDCGAYSPDEDRQYSFVDRQEAQRRVRRALEQGKLSFFLRGEKLKGSFALVRTSTAAQWLLIKHKDSSAREEDLLLEDRSVLSGLSLDDLSTGASPPRRDAARLAPAGPAEAMPEALAPMLAMASEAARSDPAWLFEPKLDGYRVIAFIAGTAVRLRSRRGIDLTEQFPEIVAELAAFGADRMVLDGEIVVLGAGGRPSFNALQNRAQRRGREDVAQAQRAAPAVLVCFDLLHFAGINTRSAPYEDRRRYLAQCLLPAAHIQLIHASPDAETLYAAAIAGGYEGVVAKRRDSLYQPGQRSAAWQKVKPVRSAEFVIGGWTRGKGAREPLGALLLGYWEGDTLEYAGHVGSGLDEAAVAELTRRTRELTRKTPPFAHKPPLHRPTTWLEPRLVAEVSFLDWTPAGLLRAPVFLRLRDDVPPRSIVRAQRALAREAARAPAGPDEVDAVLQQLDGTGARLDLTVGGERLRLTNLDRVYWPEAPGGHAAITKRMFLRYLAAVSRFMLPHLKDRPLTMIRMPEGIHGERFYQRHWEQALPEFVATVAIFSEHRGENDRYILVNNLPTLLWLGQNGTLELHVWHSRANAEADAAGTGTDYATSLETLERSALNYPDFLVFDIDPYIYSGKEEKGAEPELNDKGFATGKKVAFWVRALLQQMGLKAIVKTSGKTGLHLFVPIERSVTFDTVRQLCEMVGRHVLKDHPKEVTVEWSVGKRTGKIFIDYNMNVRGKTLAAAYSPRGSPGAPISMPLSWDELERATPGDFTPGSVIARLERTGDRWHDCLSTKQNLARILGKTTR
ncbi:MAG TPA: non-homologous end-joining DNA ligase [Steroidobacteraceae bacterium]|nr:non-homologous end-joining DNA ligase [Steroidobacteraceae bacterium]